MSKWDASWIAILVSLAIVLILATFSDTHYRTTLAALDNATFMPDGEGPELRECRPRSGWPHFFSKMENDPPFSRRKIAFLGGSVTQKKDCWRPQTMELFRRLFPKVEWQEINAAVPGTGSDLAVFRLELDVLAHNPDLILIEFLANDYGTQKQEVRRSMEGIVRKIRKHLPFTEIAFVYVIAGYMVPSYNLRNGSVPKVVAAYEAIAEHYGIPTVHLAMEILKHAEAENITWTLGVPGSQERFEEAKTFVFGSDQTHPHAFTGCAEYTKAIERAIPLIQRQSSTSNKYVGLPPALELLNYENATWVSPQKATRKGIQQTSIVEFLDIDYERDVYVARRPGDRFTLQFTGSYVGMYVVVGPFSGDLHLQLDGGARKRYEIFSTFTYYPRLAYYALFKNLSDTTHDLVISVTRTSIEKNAILAMRNRTISSRFLNQTEVGVIAFCTLSTFKKVY